MDSGPDACEIAPLIATNDGTGRSGSAVARRRGSSRNRHAATAHEGHGRPLRRLHLDNHDRIAAGQTLPVTQVPASGPGARSLAMLAHVFLVVPSPKDRRYARWAMPGSAHERRHNRSE